MGVVILNWNGWRDTIEAITSLRSSDYPNYSLYIVDNGSDDGSERHLREWNPKIRIIQAGANLGWSGGNNIGIRAALADGCAHVYLLNSDAQVCTDTISKLVAAATVYSNAAAIGSVVLSASNPQWAEFAGTEIDQRTGLPAQISGKIDDVLPKLSEGPAIAVKGCSILLTGTALRTIGLFDEDYFLNFDETDWCYRALESGFGNYLVANSFVLHKGAVAFNGTNSPLYRYFITRNRLVFASRHLGRRGLYFAWRCALWEFKQTFALSQPVDRSSIFHRVLVAAAVWLGILHYSVHRLGDCSKSLRRIHSAYCRTPRREKPKLG